MHSTGKAIHIAGSWCQFIFVAERHASGSSEGAPRAGSEVAPARRCYETSSSNSDKGPFPFDPADDVDEGFVIGYEVVHALFHMACIAVEVSVLMLV